jgi:hypothetical protein
MFENGNILGSCSKDKTIKLYDLGNHSIMQTIDVSKHSDVSSISFSGNILNY